ncbi:hypothetical protein PHISCL_09260 [Aspergillus sclerotialis]|uniref:Uncharacterized protein n=1 Tax=Aspergillus sclerotialis TaxID=2070753 RepID=A0A3A2Z5M8_9EURO|nr:hypothetical protein PHISCL_09260 [Aspergillus sclerotialis]
MSHHLSPEMKGPPENAPTSTRVKNISEISLGSPVSRSATKSRDNLSTEMTVATDSKDNRKTSDESKHPASGKGKPIKLDIPLDTTQPQEAASSKTESAGPSGSGQTAAPGSATGSRPNTPLTTTSRVSDSSAPRQHRVLRVVDTSKGEIPAPASATQSVSSNPATGKARPRRPSLSSISRPETPGEGSEADYASASASRANSPPASSRIGSAPVRSMTKSQVKKERKQKAKEAEAKKQEAAPVEEPVQAPIVGRKRKTKKTPTSNAEPSGATAEAVPETSKPSKDDEVADKPDQKAESAKKTKQKEKQEKQKKETKPTSAEEKSSAEAKSPEEAWRTKNTLEQMLKDSESTGIPIKELFSERTSSLQALLSQLHKSGELDLNNHPMFNPSNLNQRFDMKCVSDDYEILKQPIELNEEDRKTLLHGEPVRPNPIDAPLKDRCLITPRGCVLHHLSLEEEERYLALEKSVSWTVDTFQEYPSDPATEPDVTNRSGGLDALFATPENFNICWVDETSAGLTSGTSPSAPLSAPDSSVSSLPTAPLNVLSAMEADSTRSHNWAITNTAELVNATAASVRSFAAATAKHMLGAAGVVMSNIPDLDDVVGMTDDELRTFAVKSQKELEGSRKELDTIDKKMAALLKRNKKLAQQALMTTVDG